MQKYAVTIISAVLLGVSLITPCSLFAYTDLHTFAQTHNLTFSTYSPYISISPQPLLKAAEPIAFKTTVPKKVQYKTTPTYITESQLRIELEKLKAGLVQPTSPIFVSSQSDRLADSLSRSFTTQVNTVSDSSVTKGSDAALSTLTVNQLVSNGNVGIGTTSPSDTLAVNGAIYLADTTPGQTTNRLYATGGDLYYAGSLIGGATTGNWVSDGTSVWRASGNVGIGTSTPGAKLDVWGNLNVGTSSVPALFVNTNTNSVAINRASASASLDIQANGGQDALYLRNAAGVLIGTFGADGSGSGRFQFRDAGGIFSEINGNPGSATYFNAGNVGIGTTTPQGKLHVQSVNNDAVDDFVLSDSQSIKKFAISLDGANGDNYAQLRLYNNNSSVYSTIHTQSGRLSLSGPSGSNGIGLQNSLYVTDTGSVGIGTSTPSAKLHISPSAWGEYIKFGYNSSVINAGIGIDSNGSYGLTLFSRGVAIAKFEDQSGGLAIGTTYSQSATIPNGGAIFEGNVGIGTTSPARKLSVASDGTYSAYFVGRVGIGIQTPSYPLHVQGNTAIEGGIYLGATNLSGLLDVHRYCSGEGEVGGGCANDSSIVLRNAANGGSIPTSILFKPGQGDTSVAQIKALYNSVSANTSRLSFLVRDTGGNLVDRLRITESGKIGFSTTTPNNMLDVYSTSKAAIGFSGASGGTYKWTMGMDVTNGGRFAIASSSALGTNDIFVISGAGNVGIGTTTPGQKLTVVGNAQFTTVTSGTYGSDLNLTADGTLTTAASDMRLKENLEALNSSSTLDKVLQLKPYSFTWINDPTHRKDIGLIAQDVAAIFPEVTFTNESDGFMGINYSRIPALLISAVQEINQMIVGLAEKVTTKLVEAVKGVFVDVEAQKVKTQQLCIGETCITEAELKEFLDNRSGGTQSTVVAPVVPTVIPELPAGDDPIALPTEITAVTETPPTIEVSAPIESPVIEAPATVDTFTTTSSSAESAPTE